MWMTTGSISTKRSTGKTKRINGTVRALPRSSDFRSVAWAETAQHQADHGEADEHGRLASVTLVIAGEPTTTADPCEGAFDDPFFSAGQRSGAGRSGARFAVPRCPCARRRSPSCAPDSP